MLHHEKLDDPFEEFQRRLSAKIKGFFVNCEILSDILQVMSFKNREPKEN